MTETNLGHFVLLEKIGEGGMGRVYEARDTRLERLVAIKVLPEGKLADADRRARFIQEAKSASALNHPNIITIHEIGEQDGQTFIVMELVDDKALDELILPKGMRLVDTLRVATQVADALATAHTAGIVHRDVKPGNIMVDSQGRVKVLDFGLAKLIAPASPAGDETVTVAMHKPATELGMILGSVPYMSPEQAEGKPVDARGDIFSFGAVLYEMISGKRAFGGESRSSTLAAVVEKDPKPLSEITFSTPPELERLVARCLRKDINRRSQHMADVKLALAELREEYESGKAMPHAPTVEKEHDLALALRGTLGGSQTRKQLPVRWIAACLAFIALAAAVYWFAGRAKPIDSLAVMPFVNVGADPNSEYLSDGITENLINNLSQLPKLRVVPRTLVLTYKGKEMDPRKVGQELHVRAILTGRVVQRGDNLNIQTELVDVGEVSQLWGQQYNRKFTEILAVQEEIAKRVSEKLHLRTTSEEQQRLAKRYTENAEAYQLYLKGRYYWNRRTPDLLKKANEYFEQAIEKDPGYGLAYAGLAQSYAVFSAYEVLPPGESCPRGKAAGTKALEIDENLGDAHAAMGRMKTFCEWDYQPERWDSQALLWRVFGREGPA